MKGRRTQYEIYWEVLHYCMEPRSFTKIVHRCDLNSKITQTHVSFLVKRGYLDEEEGPRLYRTTEKGREYLRKFSDLYLELFDERPEFKI